jgi:hypothetical protein
MFNLTNISNFILGLIILYLLFNIFFNNGHTQQLQTHNDIKKDIHVDSNESDNIKTTQNNNNISFDNNTSFDNKKMYLIKAYDKEESENYSNSINDYTHLESIADTHNNIFDINEHNNIQNFDNFSYTNF